MQRLHSVLRCHWPQARARAFSSSLLSASRSTCPLTVSAISTSTVLLFTTTTFTVPLHHLLPGATPHITHRSAGRCTYPTSPPRWQALVLSPHPFQHSSPCSPPSTGTSQPPRRASLVLHQTKSTHAPPSQKSASRFTSRILSTTCRSRYAIFGAHVVILLTSLSHADQPESCRAPRG